MTQSNPSLTNNLGSTGTENNAVTNTTTSSTTGTTGAPPSRNNRVEGRDYLLQPSATVALLPSIAEERHHLNGNGFPIPYHKSISLIEHHQKFMSPPAGFYTDKSETYGFVQLDVLTGDGDLGTREWKETARWIKQMFMLGNSHLLILSQYEEDLEEGSDRWSKPHIASLSFHSLIKLRQLIERDGIIMLDLEERDMPGIAYRLVEDLTNKGLIRSEESPMLMRALLLKHKHVQEFERGWFGLRRNNTSAVSLQVKKGQSNNMYPLRSERSLYEDKSKVKIPASTDPCVLVRRNSTLQKNIYDLANSSRSLQRTASANYIKPNNEFINIEINKTSGDHYYPSEEDIAQWVLRKDAMRRNLPNGAEATMVMVGDIDILRKPIFVFVRLAEATFMFNVTEIPVPTRFFAILLVPSNVEMDIREIGRSFGALMSNKHFYELAMLAKSRKNLLTGINEFLDDSIVLPPGDWDNHDLLPLHLLQAKSKAIRLRRLKKQLSFVKSSESFCDGANGLVMTAPSKDADAMSLCSCSKYFLDTGQSEKDDNNPFKRTGYPFGGLYNDIKRRLPFYVSDYTDAFNFQCFSTIVFMYFASIGFVITFAGLMGEKTKNLIGTSETLTSTAMAGTFYSFFAAQPLIPIGPTGPLLVFDEILFGFCNRHDIEFLPMRSWISVWLLLITLIVVAVEGSVLVKWFTKFTQDIFAVLTALLLIFESIDNLVEIYELHPLSAPPVHRRPYYPLPGNDTTVPPNEYAPPVAFDESEDMTAQPNTALLSTILMLGTFFISYFLKEFRNSVFLGEKARRALGDFGVPIAILTMVFLDYCENDTYTQKIKVPNGLEPSSPEDRGWLINPYGIKTAFDMKYALLAVVPAILLFILIFMSQQICELLVNSKERKLVKGAGLHYDILLIAIINCGSGFFGAPWLCCAAIRAIGHVTALTVYSKNNPPGEKPTIVKVHEQRVTNLAVSLLIGCSVLLSPLLAYTPMAVLFGVFMYMGVSALSASQLYQRFILFFIPVKSHPQTPWVRRVKTWKMHLYTTIQISCLALLWGVKSWKQISLAFPFFLILLVPIRMQLKRIFSESELDALDAPLTVRPANKSR
ncbi:Anion exchange protein 3 [Orchesella cincta]|uniref:Anion exchange protein n=1 Tax=Orchesella cincta TaxID=48709 RepID=A0A1D2NIR9_ORCCI|nr:Anion exchange protein 3 [Orchesella cincta]